MSKLRSNYSFLFLFLSRIRKGLTEQIFAKLLTEVESVLPKRDSYSLLGTRYRVSVYFSNRYGTQDRNTPNNVDFSTPGNIFSLDGQIGWIPKSILTAGAKSEI